MIVDANIAVSWAIDNELSQRSRTYLLRSDLAAPDIIRLEAANAWLKYLRVGAADATATSTWYRNVERAISDFQQDRRLLPTAKHRPVGLLFSHGSVFHLRACRTSAFDKPVKGLNERARD